MTARKSAYQSPFSQRKVLSNESDSENHLMQRTYMKSPIKVLELSSTSKNDMYKEKIYESLF